MRQTFLIMLLATVVAACTTTAYPISSPLYRIPAGSKLILRQTLTIPPNAGRVYLQYGKVVTAKEKDNYHAHCWFLSWDVLDTAQTIKPDTFIITHTQKLEDVVSQEANQQFAMNGLSFGMFTGSGSPMALDYSTEMYIHSDKQPNIRRFACSHWENPDNAQHLTVAEIRKVLGKIADIQINPKK